jgi:hypothetical protein
MDAYIRNALAAMAVVLAAGCTSAPKQPETMSDPQADFSAYRSFGWYPQGNANQPKTIVDGYIRTAIENEMQRKGYALAAEGAKPDLLVEYNAASAEKVKNKPFRIGIGVGSYGSSGGGSVGVGSSGVKEVKEGSLVIHVVDPARNTEVWRGTVTRELKEGAIEQAAVNSAVVDAFTDFPARTARP